MKWGVESSNISMSGERIEPGVPVKPSASKPSAPCIAPGPPRMKIESETDGASVRGSTPASAVQRSWFQPAVTRSGSASASASMIASSTSSHIWLPKIEEAGNRGFRREPSRKTDVTGANRPSFVGTSIPPAFISIRNAIRTAPVADAGGMFVKPGAWSSESEKSKVMLEPSIVTFTAIR